MTPLHGLTIVEMGAFIAGPFATRILGDFGAEVIKLEDPAGDQIRAWGQAPQGGDSYWSMVQMRNKRSVAVNLRTVEGQAIARRILATADAVIENFKPGTLASWRLSHAEMKALNPRLIITSVSGFGQTGPYRDRAGFGNIAESMGGLRAVTGYADRPPVRVGLSLGDSVAALYAVIGTLLALYARDAGGEAAGQQVDVSLMESVFSLMEGMLPEYVHAGSVRNRSGNRLSTTAPSGVFQTVDGKWVAIGANSNSLFPRLMECVGRSDVATNPAFADNRGRVAAADWLEDIIGTWTATLTCNEVVERLADAGVPAGPIYDMADIYADPHYHARDMFLSVPDARTGEVVMPNVVPKLVNSPGSVRWAGPACGEHTREVLHEIGFNDELVDQWLSQGVVGCASDRGTLARRDATGWAAE